MSEIQSAPPKWLDEQERRAWLALITVVTMLPSALDAQLARESDINHFEYTVMAALSEQPDRMLQMKHLALVANGSLSRLSHAMTRLEQRGWVRRGKDAANGRLTVATLTDQGYQRVVSAAPGHVTEVRRLVFDPLTPGQIKALEEIAARIGAALGAPDDPFAPIT